MPFLKTRIIYTYRSVRSEPRSWRVRHQFFCSVSGLLVPQSRATLPNRKGSLITCTQSCSNKKIHDFYLLSSDVRWKLKSELSAVPHYIAHTTLVGFLCSRRKTRTQPWRKWKKYINICSVILIVAKEWAHEWCIASVSQTKTRSTRMSCVTNHLDQSATRTASVKSRVQQCGMLHNGARWGDWRQTYTCIEGDR